jgi:hypothetical protein
VIVTLTAFRLGRDATRAEFHRWVSFVAAHLPEAQVRGAFDPAPYRDTCTDEAVIDALWAKYLEGTRG